MAEKQEKKNPFAGKFNRPETVPGAAEKAKKQDAPEIPPLVRQPATYRLQPDVLNLVSLAVIEKRKVGERLTKEDAVAYAIRKTYGHLAKELE